MGRRNRLLRSFYNQTVYPDCIVENFSGVFELDTVTGRQYNDFVQSGAVVFSAGNEAVRGASDYIKLTADGSGITVPVDWVNIGSDSIDPTVGKINRIIVTKTVSEIIYVVNVE